MIEPALFGYMYAVRKPLRKTLKAAIEDFLAFWFPPKKLKFQKKDHIEESLGYQDRLARRSPEISSERVYSGVIKKRHERI